LDHVGQVEFVQVYEVEEGELIHRPDHDWGRVSDEMQFLYIGFSLLLGVAFLTTRSAEIVFTDDQITDMISHRFREEMAEDFGGKAPVGLVAMLAAMDVVRVIPDEFVPGRRRLRLYFISATGEKGWEPDLPER
jgi:hypothetical protein